MKSITDESFQEEIKLGLVLVDCFAVWCPPCKAMTPHLEAIETYLAGVVTVLKMDVDACQATTAALQIKAMPTFVLFKDGVEVDRKVGACSKAVMVEFIIKHQ